jgi:hypothetical protein
MLSEKSLPQWQNAQNEIVEAIGQKRWEGLLPGFHSVARDL